MAWNKGSGTTSKKGEKRRRAVVAGLASIDFEYHVLRPILLPLWDEILDTNAYETKDEMICLRSCLQDANVFSWPTPFNPRRHRMPKDRIKEYVPRAVASNMELIVDAFAEKFPLNLRRLSPNRLDFLRFLSGTAEISMPEVQSHIKIGMPEEMRGGEYTIGFDGFAGICGRSQYEVVGDRTIYETKVFPRWIPNPFWQYVSRVPKEGETD